MLVEFTLPGFAIETEQVILAADPGGPQAYDLTAPTGKQILAVGFYDPSIGSTADADLVSLVGMMPVSQTQWTVALRYKGSVPKVVDLRYTVIDV